MLVLVKSIWALAVLYKLTAVMKYKIPIKTVVEMTIRVCDAIRLSIHETSLPGGENSAQEHLHRLWVESQIYRAKILQDFQILTDKLVIANQLDIVMVKKLQRKAEVIDVVIPREATSIYIQGAICEKTEGGNF